MPGTESEREEGNRIRKSIRIGNHTCRPQPRIAANGTMQFRNWTVDVLQEETFEEAVKITGGIAHQVLTEPKIANLAGTQRLAKTRLGGRVEGRRSNEA